MYRRTYVLIDSRHGLKDTDIEMMKILSQCMIAFQVCIGALYLCLQVCFDSAIAGYRL
jgi:hypothetical protein